MAEAEKGKQRWMQQAGMGGGLRMVREELVWLRRRLPRLGPSVRKLSKGYADWST